MKRAIVMCTIAMVAAIAFPAALVAASDPPATSASTCAECCVEEPLCQALAALADLRSSVTELVPDAGIASSLDVKVDAATAAVLASRFTPALGQLDAFGSEVAGLADARQVSAPVSSALKAKNDELKTIVNNIR